MKELLERIRAVEDSDRGRLLSVSYSKVDLFEQCPMKYKLKYIDKMFSFNPSVATETGSLLHKVLELKCNSIINGEEVNYPTLIKGISEGIQDETEKGDDFLPGTEKLSTKYMEDWYKPDNKSGMNYPEKIQLFIDKVLPTRIEDKIWKPLAAEQPFEFVWRYGEDSKDESKAVIVHGFIDRIDYEQQNLDGTYHGLCVVDYKTSKDIFPDSKVKTPLQHFLYSLGCLHMYGELPKRHVYDFICLDKTQDSDKGEVCTKGWHKRAMKKFNKLLNEIDELTENGIFPPKPTPLCYWCDFPSKSHTPNASDKFSGSCEYYSLWKPEQKSFAKNKEWDSENISGTESSLNTSTIQQPRKLIF